MRNYRHFIAVLTILASAFSAQAHAVDPDGRIIVTCEAGHTPHLDDVARAVANSRYWASHGARLEMLTLARQSCASGSTAVNFVPPPALR